MDYDGIAEIPISKSYSDTFMEHFSKNSREGIELDQ